MGMKFDDCKIVDAAKKSIDLETTIDGIDDKIRKAQEVLDYAVLKRRKLS